MRDRKPATFVTWLSFLALLLLPTLFLERHESGWLLASYFLAFIVYIRIWNNNDQKSLFWVGFLARAGLFLSLPMLSDDVYRFLWDGLLLKNSYHPFAELPEYYLNKNLPGLDAQLYELLNSPQYFTVYPPINQFIFWLSITISENWLIAAGVMRLFIFSADIGSFILLRKIFINRGLNQNLASLYFLNPLVILEGVGNIHFEVLVIFFLMLGIYFLEKNLLKSGIGFGLAVGTKLLPLIFLPFLFLKHLSIRGWKMVLGCALTIALTLLPILSSTFLSGLHSSLSLYFKNFTFNPSLYYVAQEWSLHTSGHTQIEIVGPIFSIASTVIILIVSVLAWKRHWPIEKTLLTILTVYLAFATTIHPWYVLPLLVLGILSGHVFPVIWTLMIFITYAGYTKTGYSLHWGWIALEYLVVLLAIFKNDYIKKWLTIS